MVLCTVKTSTYYRFLDFGYCSHKYSTFTHSWYLDRTIKIGRLRFGDCVNVEIPTTIGDPLPRFLAAINASDLLKYFLNYPATGYHTFVNNKY